MRQMKLVWPHKKGSHKGDNGRVLIVGGSKEYAGALALAGVACLRSGVDYVKIAAPSKVAWAVNALSPDLVTVKCDGDYLSLKHVDKVMKYVEKADVVLIGNGISLRSRSFVKKIIKKIKKQIVVDADAIKVLSLDEVDNCIFTPHMGEFIELMKNSGIKLDNFMKLNKKNKGLSKNIKDKTSKKIIKIKNNINYKIKDKKEINKLNEINKIIKNNEIIKRIQKRLKNNIILLKGPTDYIISKNKIKLNKTGNEAMSKAGTGDVLAGLVAGFLAQSGKPFESAFLAAKVNGDAGDRLKKKKGYAFLASDIAADIEHFNKCV